MAAIKKNKLLLLAKIETGYGTDALPTGAANALVVRDVTFTPLEAEEIKRDVNAPYFGHQGVILAGYYAKLECGVELAGSGAAGTVPAWGVLARACGMSETILATTSVTYAPVTSGQEAVSLYWHMDGRRHVLLGVRGSLSVSMDAQKLPVIKYVLTGLYGTITDTAMPAPTWPTPPKPLVPSKTNTPVFTLHGYSAVMETFSLDLGNMVEPRLLVGSESIEITNRETTGSTTLQADQVANIDWFAKAISRARGALAITHGLTAGNIIQIAAPAVEVGKPTFGSSNNILNNTLPLAFCPSASTGNDELSIVVK
jgi:hypothetical protein